MNFFSNKLEAFIENHASPAKEIEKELNRETHLKLIYPTMISGNVQGQFLKMISRIKRPKNILEVGTFSGYSAMMLAAGLPDDGKITTIDINEELQGIQQKYWQKAGIATKINALVGNAIEIIPTLEEKFDLVFLDADKKNYANYYDLIVPKMADDGILLADNVLWHGKVVEQIAPKDKDTPGIIEFCKKVQNDVKVDNVMVSIRDGVLMVMKTVQ